MENSHKEIIQKQCKRMAKQYPKYLSHYTSQKVLLSILQHKQFWFGNTKAMNDKTELCYFVDNLEVAVYEDCCADKRKKLKDLFAEIHSRLNTEYPYAMCLSAAEDDAAQWERYADNAKGVCIVFNTEKLMQLLYGSQLYFTHVFYDNNIRTHLHYKNIMNYIEDKNYGFENKTGLIDNIIATASSYKHKSFISETETRVCSIMIMQSKFYKEELKNVGDIVKSFLIVNIEEFENKNEIKLEDIIEKIYIGPRSIQDEDDLKRYLEQIGFGSLKNKILKSSCPLR